MKKILVKRQIKKLRKRMFINKINYSYAEIKSITGEPDMLEEADKKTQKLINLLIEQYLDEEKDKEFIEKYKDEQFVK